MNVSRKKRISAKIQPPADKSISHRALIFNAIADGKAELKNLLDSEDVRSTAHCLSTLGIPIDWSQGKNVIITGKGLRGFQSNESQKSLDCNNSGTTMRLLSGILPSQSFPTTLEGDASLQKRPMGRIIEPLTLMNANITGTTSGTAPLQITPSNLHGITYDMPVASAQVKSAILLAGLYTNKPTTVVESEPTRNHTELMLQSMGAKINHDNNSIQIEPSSALGSVSLTIPGDISSAAPRLVLGACHPNAEIQIQEVGTNPTRTGLLDILLRMGAQLEIETITDSEIEPMSNLLIRTSQLIGTTIAGEEIPRAIDELPLIALLGCYAKGQTIVRDAQELRVKESNRIDAIISVLGAMGAKINATEDGFVVEGGHTLTGTLLDGQMDHRIGILAAIAGALAEDETEVINDAVSISYPTFWNTLKKVAQV